MSVRLYYKTSAGFVELPVGSSWTDVANKPTTIAGYGITDAYTKSDSDGRYIKLTGGAFTGIVTAPTPTETSPSGQVATVDWVKSTIDERSAKKIVNRAVLEADGAPTFDIGEYHSAVVYINGILALEGETYSIMNGTVRFLDEYKKGTEIVIIVESRDNVTCSHQERYEFLIDNETTPATFTVAEFLTVAVYIDSVLANEGESYTITGTTIRLLDAYPLGTTITIITEEPLVLHPHD